MARESPADEAQLWRARAALWAVAMVVAGVGVVGSVFVVQQESGVLNGSRVGRAINQLRNRAVRVNPGGMYRAEAIVYDDGAIDFYPHPVGGLLEDWLATIREGSKPVCEVSIFLIDREKLSGWFGLTSHHRPLRFELTLWTIYDDSYELSLDVRRRLHRLTVDDLCGGFPVSGVCALQEVLATGIQESRETMWGTNMTNPTYTDSYRISTIRWQGWAHNLLTLGLIAFVPFAYVRRRRAVDAYRYWTAVAQRSTCPTCGYDLRLLPQPRCPECGTSLVVTQAKREG